MEKIKDLAILDQYADQLKKKEKELDDLINKYKEKLSNPIVPVRNVIKLSDLKGKFTKIDFES